MLSVIMQVEWVDNTELKRQSIEWKYSEAQVK